MSKTFEEITKEINIEPSGRKVAMNAISFRGDIYMFGIWSGVSAGFISNYLYYAEYKKMYGFDSFTGLPKEKKGYVCHPGHLEGKYSSIDLYEGTVKGTIKTIKEGISNGCLELIPGFFSEVLNKKLVKDHNMQVASFIDIDVDLYTSTIDVLEFMFKNKLIGNGTIVYFDDWGATEEYKGGESLAWQKTTDKYGIKYKEIYSSGNRPNVMKVFKIIL